MKPDSLSKHKANAMTLVETLVYLVLFGVIFVAIMQFVISTRKNDDIAGQRNELEKAVLFIVNHLDDSFSQANGVINANTVFNSNTGKIRLQLATKYVEYNITGSKLHFSDNGTDYPLLDVDYQIDKFYLEQILNNDNVLMGVRCEIQVTSIRNPTITKDFRTSFMFK
jgi:hypothetical protein